MSIDNTESEESTECPTCGREDFKSVHGMKIHHSRVHDESIAGVKTTCQNCGNSFRADPYRARDASRRDFCSCDCMGKWRSENFVGKDATNWRGGGVEVKCQHCGDSFQVKQAKYESDDPRSAVKYCSIECRNAGFVGRYGGESNPRWKGGEFSYGPGWNSSTKDFIRERDGFRCHSCGMSENEHQSRGCQSLHVHHICGARESTNPAVYNAPRNLVLLCVWCHRKWEKHSPTIPPEAEQPSV